MRAVVKAFEWEAVDIDPLTDQVIELVLHAGPINQQGEEMFTVHVCTPAALLKVLERDGALVGRHFLFVDHVDTGRVEAFISDRLRRIDGDTWSHLASKIGRIGHWEFEDYEQ